jgi:cobyrinic acid a,c-diamide synthase
VVVAAPGSGHGKTTVCTGLLAALRARGLTVAPFKVGPDFIDPSYHALAAGRPGRNLDPFLVGPQRVGPLFGHGSRGAEVAVVEGVMGLYDGMFGGHGFASTAHVASLLDAPVLLVVDASAQGESVAAVVHGFASYRPGVRIGGVLLNRVGSDRHETILRDALAATGIPVLGVLRRCPAAATPSRHLGLVPAAERSAAATSTVEALGRVVAESVDLAAVLALARAAGPLPAPAWDPGAELGGPARVGAGAARPVLAVAGGPAFTFGYAEHAELLAAAGAEVVRLDPVRDTALPAGVRGLVLGGGFPEEYGEALAANSALREQVRAFAADGGVVVAECGGLLYLAAALDGWQMCGVLAATATMTDRLTLGYRTAVALSDSVLAAAGERVHGHEFHHTRIRPRAGDQAAWRWRDAEPEGFVGDRLHASYLHLHWAGAPRLVRRLVAACR